MPGAMIGGFSHCCALGLSGGGAGGLGNPLLLPDQETGPVNGGPIGADRAALPAVGGLGITRGADVRLRGAFCLRLRRRLVLPNNDRFISSIPASQLRMPSIMPANWLALGLPVALKARWAPRRKSARCGGGGGGCGLG